MKKGAKVLVLITVVVWGVAAVFGSGGSGDETYDRDWSVNKPSADECTGWCNYTLVTNQCLSLGVENEGDPTHISGVDYDSTTGTCSCHGVDCKIGS